MLERLVIKKGAFLDVSGGEVRQLLCNVALADGFRTSVKACLAPG